VRVLRKRSRVRSNLSHRGHNLRIVKPLHE
jgi:hypothetical protein